MELAISSLPVPDSPRIRTVVLVPATRAISSYICRMGPLVPTRLEKSYRRWSSSRSCAFSLTSL